MVRGMPVMSAMSDGNDGLMRDCAVAHLMFIADSSVRPCFRRTHHIGWRQARNFLETIHDAEIRLVERGRPLNTFATINFGHIACSPTLVSTIFEKLRDNHFVRWLRYGTSEFPYYVWSSRTPAAIHTFTGSFTSQNHYERRSTLNSVNGLRESPGPLPAERVP
jgi:hypothetical protein